MRHQAAAIAAAMILAGPVPVTAATYTNLTGINVELPGGEISFADALVSLSGGLVADPDGVQSLLFPQIQRFPPGTIVPLPLARNGAMALGAPDTTFTAVQTCVLSLESGNVNWIPGCNSVSLGVGGALTVQFTDNFLTGSGTNALDLWIFETGPDIEDTKVEVSTDGIDWIDVGRVGGSTSGIDLDGFGFGPTALFSFVRLTDDPAEGQLDGATVGADIDAIAAISTTAVPLPAGSWLLATAVGTLAARRARARRQRP
jgi:hypothetical protein